MSRIAFIAVAVLLIIPCITQADVIDVMIKGIDDGVQTNKQQDYNEAVMNAKLQAIERAGIEIKSITRVVNFQTKFDMVESKAKAALLPGFQVMDIGYQTDGTYLVILSGKVETVSEGIESKELRYAKSLIEKGQVSKAKGIINKIIRNSKDDDAIAEAIYCQILWKLSSNYVSTFEKLKAYYPDSKYVKLLEPILMKREAEFAARRGSVLAQEGNLTAYSTEIVYDKNTGFEWYVGPDKEINWNDATKWAENLDLAGGGWRLPNFKEFKTLYPKGVETHIMTTALRTTSGWWWSSATKDWEHAYVFGFRHGHWGVILKELGQRVIAVRSPR